GRPLARLCQRSTGTPAGAARIGGLADRSAWPAGISASGEPRHAARDARRTLGGLRRARRGVAAVSALPRLQPRVRSAEVRRRRPRLAPRFVALPACRTEGGGHDGRRHRGLVRRPEAGRRPRPPGGGGAADPQLAAAGELLAEAMINTQEAADTLRRYLEALDIDPARQEEIER